MVNGLKQRTLEKLAYREWEKDKTKSSAECWIIAEGLLKKLDKRYKVTRKNKKRRAQNDLE